MQRSSATPANPPLAPSALPFATASVRRHAGSAAPGVVRRAVLAGALALGLALGPWWHPNLAGAADDSEATGSSAPAATGSSAPAATGSRAAAAADDAAPAGTATPVPSPQGKSATGSGGAPDADANISISPHGIVISGSTGTTSEGPRIDVEHGRVKVEGFGHDRQYDSFEQFMRDAPGTAFFVFLIVTVVFLVPLLVVALLVWYKIRKTRMYNETMLKLAERGTVSPSVAMEALAAGATPAAALDAFGRSPTVPPAGTAPGAVPAYEHARMFRRRTAWSDLRKGVILIAIGVGFSAYSMFDDGTPNFPGLICLFLGIGYCVLWFFQDRPPTGQNQSPPSPPGGA